MIDDDSIWKYDNKLIGITFEDRGNIERVRFMDITCVQKEAVANAHRVYPDGMHLWIYGIHPLAFDIRTTDPTMIESILKLWSWITGLITSPPK